jgi:hypothetical protein
LLVSWFTPRRIFMARRSELGEEFGEFMNRPGFDDDNGKALKSLGLAK